MSTQFTSAQFVWKHGRSNGNTTSQYLCLRCSRDKKNPQKFSKEHNMIPSAVPCELQGLTQVEEMLIAWSKITWAQNSSPLALLTRFPNHHSISFSSQIITLHILQNALPNPWLLLVLIQSHVNIPEMKFHVSLVFRKLSLIKGRKYLNSTLTWDKLGDYNAPIEN